METIDFDDEKLPQHIANFLRQQTRDRATLTLEKAEALSPRMDNDEMREIERGQQFPGYNFMR